MATCRYPECITAAGDNVFCAPHLDKVPGALASKLTRADLSLEWVIERSIRAIAAKSP